MSKLKKPATVNEAVDYLLADMKQEDLASIKKMKKSDLISLHFGLGMRIRNHFNLWSERSKIMEEQSLIEHQKFIERYKKDKPKDYAKMMADPQCRKRMKKVIMRCHEDDVSSLIIERLWKKLKIR
jgi:hypothetical protein